MRRGEQFLDGNSVTYRQAAAVVFSPAKWLRREPRSSGNGAAPAAKARAPARARCDRAGTGPAIGVGKNRDRNIGRRPPRQTAVMTAMAERPEDGSTVTPWFGEARERRSARAPEPVWFPGCDLDGRAAGARRGRPPHVGADARRNERHGPDQRIALAARDQGDACR